MKGCWLHKQERGQCLTLVEDNTIVVVLVTDQRSGKTIIVLYKMMYGQNQNYMVLCAPFVGTVSYAIAIEQWKQLIPFFSLYFCICLLPYL